MEGQGQPDLRDDGTPKEKLHEEEVVDEQDVFTQEPASLNILVDISTNPRTKEPEDEVIPDFMDEYCTETSKSSHDTEITDI